MKRFFLLLSAFFILSEFGFCDDTSEVMNFFNDWVNAANTYSNDYFSYYAEDAKIIRVVEKPDGTKKAVNIPFSRYKKETKNSVKLAKLRRYKNNYYNIKILPHGKDYKVSAMRMPSASDYKIPAYLIIGKNEKGEWKIKEESMNTKVQAFLSAT